MRLDFKTTNFHFIRYFPRRVNSQTRFVYVSILILFVIKVITWILFGKILHTVKNFFLKKWQLLHIKHNLNKYLNKIHKHLHISSPFLCAHCTAARCRLHPNSRRLQRHRRRPCLRCLQLCSHLSFISLSRPALTIRCNHRGSSRPASALV